MKRIVLLPAALFCMVCAAGSKGTAVAAENVSDSKPKLVLPRAEYDFGKINSKGGTVKHDFMVHNVGTAPLVIIKTYTSCSCTEAKYPRKPIMPGDSAAITVSYNPRTQSGSLFKAIQVYSNDPAKRSVITIKGKVE